VTILEVVSDALMEIGVLGSVDAATGEDATLGLLRLNKILDNLNAEQRSVYASTFDTYTLTPSLNPHTIGASGGTWTVTQRPESIEAANILISDIRHPVSMHDAQWWSGISTPETESDIPTDLYYERAWPLGKVWLYPVPSAAYELEIVTRVVLSSVALADDFTLPPGYQDAITLTLAEDLTAPFRVPVPQTLPLRAQKARGRVWSANAQIPRLRTADDGLGGGRSTWDYRTGRY
jgi:hypothetical protein